MTSIVGGDDSVVSRSTRILLRVMALACCSRVLAGDEESGCLDEGLEDLGVTFLRSAFAAESIWAERGWGAMFSVEEAGETWWGSRGGPRSDVFFLDSWLISVSEEALGWVLIAPASLGAGLGLVGAEGWGSLVTGVVAGARYGDLGGSTSSLCLISSAMACLRAAATRAGVVPGTGLSPMVVALSCSKDVELEVERDDLERDLELELSVEVE